VTNASVLQSIRARQTWVAPFKFAFLFGENNDVLDGNGWVGAMVIVVALTMVVQMALTPLASSLLATVPSAADLTPQQQAHAASIYRSTRYLGAALMPISIPLKLLLTSWVTYMLAVLLDIRITFRQLLTAFSVAALIPAFCAAITGLVNLVNRPESFGALTPDFGLDFFFAPQAGALRAILSGFSIVLLWQFAVLLLYLIKQTRGRVWSALVLALPAGLLVPAAFNMIAAQMMK
jgi:hypothetical protein